MGNEKGYANPFRLKYPLRNGVPCVFRFWWIIKLAVFHSKSYVAQRGNQSTPSIKNPPRRSRFWPPKNPGGGALFFMECAATATRGLQATYRAAGRRHRAAHTGLSLLRQVDCQATLRYFTLLYATLRFSSNHRLQPYPDPSVTMKAVCHIPYNL